MIAIRMVDEFENIHSFFGNVTNLKYLYDSAYVLYSAPRKSKTGSAISMRQANFFVISMP